MSDARTHESRVAAAEEAARAAQAELAECRMECNQLRAAIRGQHEVELRLTEQLSSVREQWRRAQRVMRTIQGEGRDTTEQWKSFCPLCRRGPADSHALDCELALLINAPRSGN